MKNRLLAGTGLLLSIAMLSPMRRAAADEGLCAPPPDTTESWKLVQAPGIAMRLPPGYTQYSRNDQGVTYSTGNRTIGFGLGNGPDEVSSRGQLFLLDVCNTTIGGRPVTIRVLHFTKYDPPQAPSGDAGPRYLAVARWQAIEALPGVAAYILSPDRNDLGRLKAVFYSADVGIKMPSPCRPVSHLPPPDSVVDSAAIALRLASSPAPWPIGVMELTLRFDSAGALGSMAVGDGDLPDVVKRSIAMVIGTNVRERPRGSVKLQVNSTPAGFGYATLEVISCPK
jgi:hypothetical protein